MKYYDFNGLTYVVEQYRLGLRDKKDKIKPTNNFYREIF